MARRGVDQAAREALGFTLSAPQREAVEALVAGRDALVVMPTGAGKSAVYQLAGLLRGGLTIVVSPLIALQHDQLDAFAGIDGASAAALNSTLPEGVRAETIERLVAVELDFVLLAPEQLADEETLAFLRSAEPALFAVDEAHCISEWGHDFRPDYLRLGAVAEALGRPPVAAVTATASPPVRTEIAARLGLRDPLVLVRGFDRPNIRLAVHDVGGDERVKRDALLDAVASTTGPGLVYVATRAASEQLAADLAERGLRAAAYHGGLAAGPRDATQAAFMDDALDVVCATTAFGLGVDKPNVRFVFHGDPADSLDAYYQEVGRAGRDGEPAEACLFYRPEDVGVRRFFAGAARLDAHEAELVAEAVAEEVGGAAVEELAGRTGLSPGKVAAAVGRLEELDAVTVDALGEVSADTTTESEDAGELAAEAQARRREFERSRVEMMRGYAETRDCRRRFLLSSFGEPYEEPCGNCDRCEEGVVMAPADTPFPVGARVRHARWGAGAVQRYEDDTMVVLFDEAGYRTLATDVVAGRGLLEAIP